MITCSNCGQLNAEGTRVCRYCGTGFVSQPQATQTREYVPPTSAWNNEPYGASPAQPYAAASAPQANYRCPHCGSTNPPQVAKRVSTDGWIVFALLLFFCLPLFWIGLLMKEEYRMCAMCGSKFG